LVQNCRSNKCKAFDYHSSIFKLFLQKPNNPKSLEVSKSKGLNQDVSNRLWLNKSEGDWPLNSCNKLCYLGTLVVNPLDRSLMRKGQDCDCDKRDIYMVICDTYIPKRFDKSCRQPFDYVGTWWRLFHKYPTTIRWR
jgi:hypothetical protein